MSTPAQATPDEVINTMINHPCFTRFLIVLYDAIKIGPSKNTVQQSITCLSDSIENSINALEMKVHAKNQLGAHGHNLISTFFINFFQYVKHQDNAMQESIVPHLELIAYYLASINLTNYILLKATNSSFYKSIDTINVQLCDLFFMEKNFSKLDLKQQNVFYRFNNHLPHMLNTLGHQLYYKISPAPLEPAHKKAASSAMTSLNPQSSPTETSAALPMPQPTPCYPALIPYPTQCFFSPMPENALKRSMPCGPLEEPVAKQRKIPDPFYVDHFIEFSPEDTLNMLRNT